MYSWQIIFGISTGFGVPNFSYLDLQSSSLARGLRAAQLSITRKSRTFQIKISTSILRPTPLQSTSTLTHNIHNVGGLQSTQYL
ncbi:hypothetical protein MJO28_014809 [Puccinia striiformis f. sp. tritici]|uniref:Uncharacterized protein n=1 Tax=Puccinia striiformis f. sp. tritici TaxID=168172 RepID=A0ACC0DS89_9BASI|nr:hypothetical protein MJO28_014809 [Puccinia striiformis f. sp. tritici]